MIRRIEKCKGDIAWTGHNTFYAHKAHVVFRMSERCGILGLDIQIRFHGGQEVYDFNIFDEVFYFERNRIEGKYNEMTLPVNFVNLKSTCKLLEIPYTDFEEMIFQQSLIQDLGMFGAQEAEQILKLRNKLFGEKN